MQIAAESAAILLYTSAAPAYLPQGFGHTGRARELYKWQSVLHERHARIGQITLQSSEAPSG
jgi:hypothetical protein